MHLIFSSIIILFTEKVKRQETKKIFPRSAVHHACHCLEKSYQMIESKTILVFLMSHFPPCLLSFLLYFCPDPWFLYFPYSIGIFHTYPAPLLAKVWPRLMSIKCGWWDKQGENENRSHPGSV